MYKRQGQASVNATYNNKVAVLVGDFILSTALLHVSYSHSEEIVRYLAELGQNFFSGVFGIDSAYLEEINKTLNLHIDTSEMCIRDRSLHWSLIRHSCAA